MRRLVSNFPLFFLFGLSLDAAASPDWSSVGTDSEAAWALAEQSVIPTWRARLEQAEVKEAARERYFREAAPLSECFPDFVGLDLSDLAVVRGRLLMLEQRAEDRARERLVPVPPFGYGERNAQYRGHVEAALRAEARVDALERRYLTSLKVLYEVYPDLEREGLERLRSSWKPRPVPENASQDAVDRFAVEQAGYAQNVRRLNKLMEEIRFSATSPDAAAPDMTLDFEAMQKPEEARAAVDRMILGARFQGLSAASVVEQAATKWLRSVGVEQALVRGERAKLEAADALPQDGDVERFKVGLREAEERVELIQEKIRRIDVAESEVNAARVSVLEVELQAAVEVVEVWRVGGEALASRAEGVDAGLEASLASHQAQEAQERADAARQEGIDTRGQNILDGLAASQARRKATWERVTAYREASAEATSTYEDGLTRAAKVYEDHRSRSLLLADRDEVDTAYRQLREVTVSMRENIADILELLLEAVEEQHAVEDSVRYERNLIGLERSAVAALVDEAERSELESALASWDEALTLEMEGADEWLSTVRSVRDYRFAQLSRARDIRRLLSGYLSSEALLNDRRYLLKDIVAEVSLLPPQLVATQRENMRRLSGLPNRLLDYNFLLGSLSRAVTMLLVLGIWWVGRGASAGLVRGLLIRARRAGFELMPKDIQALATPGVTLCVAAVDLIVGYLVMGTLSEDFPLIGLFVLAYLQVALYRLIVASFDLVVVAHPQERPALRVMVPAVYELSRITLRYIVVWLIGRRFLEYLLEEALNLGAMSILFGWTLNIVGLGLVVWLLHHWEPHLRKRVQRLNTENWIVSGLGGDQGSAALQAPRAVVASGLILSAICWDLLHQLASRSRELGLLMNVVSRYQLGVKESEVGRGAALTPEVSLAIRGKDRRGGLYIPRHRADLKLDECWSSWQREGRRGLVAVVGDHGDGKRTTLQRFEERVVDAGGVVRNIELTGRLTTRESFVDWLADSLGLAPMGGDVEKLTAAIKDTVPPGVVVVHRAHWAYLRTVGGFEALRAMLYVFNTCGEKHFWVLSLHRPAWAYLSRLGSLVNVEVLRRVVVLDPFDPKQVHELAMTRLGQLGLKADFSGIVRKSIFAGDPELELERATATFFRLLAEASDGNPSVALEMWTRCLEMTSDDGQLKVRMDDCLSAFLLEEATDGDLFTLTAVRTQNVIAEHELVRVTNMSPAQVRSTVKHLQSIGVLSTDQDRVWIEPLYLPVVTRTLRRRRFIPWSE